MECFIVDTFTVGPDSGNPAAVCPLATWPDDEAMLRIAAQMGFSETAFFVPNGSAFDIRWFTPTREVDMIGHATLAAGCVVLQRIAPNSPQVTFRSGGRNLIVSHGKDANYALEMPSLPPSPLAIQSPESQKLAIALGADPSEMWAAKHYLCVYEDAKTVHDLTPDLVSLSELALPAVIVTAPGVNDADFVSRFFAPANGVPEDPVSGVAHLCLAPYWAIRLGKQAMLGYALSSRGGLVRVEHRGLTVVLGGHATIVN